MVSSNYFKTYGIPILHGRAFSEQDTAASVHVAMVNQKFADKYFAGKDPLQQRINVEELIPGVTKLGRTSPGRLWVFSTMCVPADSATTFQ